MAHTVAMVVAQRRALIMSELNQCDGCNRNLPIENGIHVDGQLFGMLCTKNRYQQAKTTEEVSKFTMPFTGHEAEKLSNILDLINKSGLAIEAFDVFLAEYARTKDLDKAWWFAQCEWDL